MNGVPVFDDVFNAVSEATGWAVVDVETSGLRPYEHRVLSVAVLTLDPSGDLVQEFSTLLDPGCDPGPVHIHGLTAQRLRGAPVFEEVAEHIGTLLAGRVMVAHNAQFDYEFLAHEFARARSWLPVSQRMCTLALNRRVAPPTDDLKLASLAAHYNVPQQRAHDALDDARVLAGILRGSLSAAGELGLALPLVACPPKQGSGYPPRVPKTPCAHRNPGPLAPGAPLVQGMKVAFTGDTRTAREELIARSVAAGLNVMGSVSRHTSVLVTNECDCESAKYRAARGAGVPVITEGAFLGLLTSVQPGTAHTKPAPSKPSLPAQRRTGHPASAQPLSGRRVLVLGGHHDQASALRTRITEQGGAAAVNLSAGVTDVILLTGGAEDRRMPHITARGLPVHDGDWLATLTPPSGTAAQAGTADPARAPVLPRGGVFDLPTAHGDAGTWTVTASWGHQADCEIDVVAFLLDEDEQVLCDEDFVFYGAPESPDATVRLTTDGPSEQAITADLSTLSDAVRKIVIAAAIDKAATFADAGAIEITVAQATDAQALAQATLDAATTERTLLLAEVYRRGPGWRVRAIGQGYDHQLADLARGFGVDIID
ncbi:DEDDh family exonuclease [Streptomyces sp. NBC_00120]|uniref:DEDDh family exonuclease n=1 Tax=unclassified Streptomyces TaxID=2593676 RepID=UPI002255F50F|nr:DEDDh family exonuclease [Streptomyces sp. NBC_00120]MCX5321381.1 DEDDh family exonuclease [Streptomyces sp. NBC_00120]